MAQRKSKGKRPIIFAVVGMNGEDILKDEILALSEDDAASFFEEKHSFEPLAVMGAPHGYYRVKGGKTEDTSDLATLTLSGRDLRYTGDCWEGVYDGWKGAFNGVKACTINGVEYEDNALVRPTMLELADSSNKVPKPRFAAGVVIKQEDVDDLVESQ